MERAQQEARRSRLPLFPSGERLRPRPGLPLRKRSAPAVRLSDFPSEATSETTGEQAEQKTSVCSVWQRNASLMPDLSVQLDGGL